MAPGVAPDYVAPGRGWRLRHSAWLLAPILGIGYLSWVGFLYCALRVRSRQWWIVATVSILLTLTGYVIMGVWTTTDGSPSSNAVLYIIQLWVASIIFGFLIHPDYLRWRATRKGRP